MRLEVTVLALALATACGSGEDNKAPKRQATTKATDGGTAATGTAEGPPPRAPVTAAKLAPVIQAIGVEAVVPTAVVIQLATPVVDAEALGDAGKGSVLEIAPEIPGRLVWTGVSTLTFKPTHPFEFATKYHVELKKLETPTGIVEPPAGTTWALDFATPEFAFLGWAPSSLDLDKHTITFDLSFSGAVQPNRAKPFLAFTASGKAVAKVDVAPGGPSEPHVIHATIVDPRIVAGAALRVAVKKDLPAAIGARAAAGSAEYVVSADKAISVKGIQVQEGATGFYIEVVCDDAGAGKGDRSYYARDSSIDVYGLSDRCQLSDEAAAKIRFKPEVKKTYITPGKAGFRIFGEFKRGSYAMTIPGGSVSVDGGVLLAPYRKTVSVPARKPQLAFAGEGRYLPRTAWSNLGIKHVNVDEVNLLVRHIPPENLVFWLGDDSSETADERTSNLILKQTIPLRGEPDAPTTTWVDVSTLLPATTKGVLELRLAAVGANAASRLLLTNISLVAKKSAPPSEPWNQKVSVWALDMDSTALLDGVDVSLVRKSGKVVARCSTQGAKGCVLELPPGDEDPDRSEPFAILARKGDDLTYIRYKDLRTEVAESSVSGVPYQSENPYHGTVWPDRGVYRPGETAHLVALLRDKRDAAPNPLPVDVKLVDPRAKTVRKLTLKTNAAGMVVFDHAFPAFADTGHYKVEVAIADKTVAEVGIQVEEFVPERMKVTAQARKPGYLPSDDVEVDVGAQYLFGGSAAGSAVEVVCAIAPDSFEPESNADFTYGVEPRGKPVTLGDQKLELDEKGHQTLTCPSMDEGTAFTQTGKLSAKVAVLEAGSGRTTTRVATTMVHPEKYYLGLKTGTEKAVSGKAFTVTGIVVDWTGKPAPSAVKELSVEQLHLEAEYDYGYDEEEGGDSYQRNVHAVSEGRSKVTVTDGKFSFDVTPVDASVGYVVRVGAGKAVTELHLEGEYPYYAEDYGQGGVDHTPRPARPTRLKLDAPKAVGPGEPVNVKVLAPYRGKMLFTVETDRVVTAEWKDVTGGEVTFSWKPAEYTPNVYVSAFLVKDPHGESKEAYLPARAFGVTSVRMTPTELTQQLKVEVPESVRSGSKLDVKLDLGATDGPTFAVVAVVDEGILSLTDFATPDPLAALLPKRALGVETYETVGWTMLHAPSGTSSRSGGGDDEDAGEGGDLAAGRVQPVKPVALFSGLVEVSGGKATVPFELPTYRGQLRVMAFTAGSKRVGRAEAHVTVKDPLVVQVTFPRFATQDDEMQIPVFLTNMSGGPLEVSLALTGEALPVKGMTMPKDSPAPLAFLGKDSGTLSLADGEAKTAVFQVRAAVPVGAARLKIAAKGKGKAGSFEVKDEVDVPFVPSGPRERIVQKLKIEQGSTDLTAALRGWLPTSEKSTFWLTANPYGESFDHLKYLIHYPYGCVEQTTSSTRPLLYVSQLVSQIDPAVAEGDIEEMVLAGVNRILSMQTPSGGIGYWPGDSEPNDWGTAYATHMLLDAKAAGYPVPEDRLKDILGWIDERVGQIERGEDMSRYHYYDQQAEPYLHFVLAKAGKGKKARIARLIADLPAKQTMQRAEDAYMLKAAAWLAGDRRWEKDLRALDATAIVEDRVNGWSFYSDRRRRGFMLSTYFDLFGRGPEGEALAQRIGASLAERPSWYYTTQELVWGVTGLGKWVAGAAKDFEPGKLTADGRTLEARPTKVKASDRTWALVRASEYKKLVLDLPKKGEGDLYLIASSEGVREKPTVKVGGEGLKISRTYRTLAGDTANLGDGSVKLGDLLFVELEIANTTGEDVRNIVLVDRLPAGLEIENARLGRGTNPEWVDADAQWQMDYMNMRDDRIEAFGALGPRASKKVVYTVRAVTAGKFTVPPVEAEAMYDPSVWARAKGETALIGGPWAEVLL